MSSLELTETSTAKDLSSAGYLTVTGLSNALGVTRMTIYRHLATLDIKPDIVRLTGQKWFSPESVLSYKKELGNRQRYV